MKWIRANWVAVLVGVTLSTIFFAPIRVYMQHFGSVITSDHQKWAAMGSAMSGIYGPILSALTFVVLVMQIRLQWFSHRQVHDQEYIQNARADIEFYLAKLDQTLDMPTINGIVPRKYLRERFSQGTLARLAGDEAKGAALALEFDAPQIQAAWIAIYTIYKGLQAEPRFPYTLQFVSAQQKAIATLSYPICVALDNYVYCATGGRIIRSYQFSPILSERSNNA